MQVISIPFCGWCIGFMGCDCMAVLPVLTCNTYKCGCSACAGRSAQSAARNVAVASNGMAESTTLQLKELGSQLIRELQQDLQNRSVAPKEELNSLVAQLEVRQNAKRACMPDANIPST